MVVEADIADVPGIFALDNDNAIAVWCPARPAGAGRGACRSAPGILAARREEKTRRRKKSQSEQKGPHRFLHLSGHAAKGGGFGRDCAAAAIAAYRRAGAREVGHCSGGLASKRLSGELDIKARLSQRADLNLLKCRGAARQVIAIIDRHLRLADAPRRRPASAHRALAIILCALIEHVPLGEHVSRLFWTIVLTIAKDA